MIRIDLSNDNVMRLGYFLCDDIPLYIECNEKVICSGISCDDCYLNGDGKHITIGRVILPEATETPSRY